MDRIKYYIAPILKDLCTNVFSDICENVFAGHRPSGIEGMQDFLVVRTSSSIGDHNAYQQGSCYIEIHVRNLEHGLENTLKLQEILDSVIEKMPYISEDNRFVIKNPQLVIRGDDGLEFSTWTVRSSLQINTTDRFSF